ncbi:hypothetical protein OC834_001232 [Tilletia horrida]|nr:hypothetical protein OC834_001232 [Tilletia horrida]
MNASPQKPWSDILKACDRFLDLFEQRVPLSSSSTIEIRISFDDSLLNYGTEAFRQALARFRLSEALMMELVGVYKRGVARLCREATTQPLQLQISSGDALTREQVELWIRRLLERQCDRFQRIMTEAVEAGLQRVVVEEAGQDALEDVDFHLMPLDLSHAARKHPPQALAILERAFSLSANITHAEKSRLANAIGLTPRQVTVWFQNRRNRKKPPSVLTSGAASTPTTSSGKKRKLASIHDDEDDDEDFSDDARMPVDLPEKRQRCSRQASYDSFSSFTSSSYASSGSEWTPAGQKYGRIGKPRNDSRDSNLTANTSISADSSQSLISSPQAIKPASDDDEQDEIEDDEEGSEDQEDDLDEEEEEEEEDDDDTDDDEDDEEQPLRPVQPAPHEFLFHPDGTLQPDWDDLELDLGQLEKSLVSSFALNTSLGSPAPIGLPPQALTPAALRMLDDLTPTAATFAEQQHLAASINPTVAAFNSISHAENWSLLESGVFNLPSQHQQQQQQEGMPDFPATDDWARALLNFECDSEQIDEALRAMDEALGRTSQQSTPSLEQAAFPHIDSSSSLSSSSHSDAGSSLHLDFDFDFSRLGFTSSPLSTPSLCSDSSGTFSADASGFTFEKEEHKL